MAEQITIKPPELEDIGLTNEGEKKLAIYMQSLQDQLNLAIKDIEDRLTALE